MFKIIYILSTHLVFYRLTQHREKILGERLKLSFERLGITFIKVGQALSMRYDILSREDCVALQQLLDSTNPIEFSIIEQVLNKEYQKPYSKVFKSFDKTPIGCASISQVHKAILPDGTVVAVKIKRPGVDKFLHHDIRLMKFFAFLGSTVSPTLRGLRVREIVRFFETWITQDVDFRHEILSIKRLKRQSGLLSDKIIGEVYCMDVYEKFCTDNIIVMEFVNGIPLSRREEIESNKNYDIEKTIHTFVNSAIMSWFVSDSEGYYYQADPHLSNVLALPDGGVANIDCGLVYKLDKRETTICKNLILFIYFKDGAKLTRVITDMCNVNYHTYKDILEDDIITYLEKTDEEGLGFWFFELTKILVKHKINYPSFLITLGRGNVILDGLITTYLPNYSTLDVLGNQLIKRAHEYFFDTFDEKYMLRTGYALLEKLKINFDNPDPFKETFQFISNFSKATQGKLK